MQLRRESAHICEEFDTGPGKWDVEKRALAPVFGRYVTRNSTFVTYLSGVRDQIEAYVSRTSVKRPLNILLAAAPGSGKSFLIKQLISTINSDLDIAFEEVYIASLENSSELYSVFQRVQSINLEGKLPAIFFDEVDSAINGTKLYPKFLAPMWDGTFYIGKERFVLGKSIFFFAGSTLSLEDGSNKILEDANTLTISYDEYFDRWKSLFDDHVKSDQDKLLDFVDRVDAIIRIPPVRKELLGDQCKSEYEDLVCMLVDKHFPKVKFIGKAALEIICNELTKGSSLRVAEKIVFNSKPVDPEIFDRGCLPRRYKAVDQKETSFVEIVRHPKGELHDANKSAEKS